MKKENIEDKAKRIAKDIQLEAVDQFNYRIRKDITDTQVIQAMRVLSHFISIPVDILNKEEVKMFNEELFEKINVSKKD